MKDVRAVKSRHKRDNSILVAVIVLFAIMAVIGLYYLYQLNAHPHKQTALNTSTMNQSSVLSENTEQLTNLSILSHKYIVLSGKRYLRVHVVITNTTADAIQFSPLLQFDAVGENGNTYPFTAEISQLPLGGPIPAGKNTEGDLDFSVDIDTAISSLSYRETPTSTFRNYSLDSQ